MTKKANQWYFITDHQIRKLAAQSKSYPGALQALERANSITAAGQTPLIFHSELNGFRVINNDDPEEFKIGLSISSRAKNCRCC